MKYKSEYLALGGSGCPYCRASEINAGALNVDHGGIEQKVECEKCGRAWVDIYKLIDVDDALQEWTKPRERGWR
jgi:hypothetical protein